MKERLRGLMALVLCLALSMTPFSGALAEIAYSSKEQSYAIQTGDLVSTGVTLVPSDSGGALLHYHEDGLADDTPDKTVKISESDGGLRSHDVIEIATEPDTYAPNLWHIANVMEATDPVNPSVVHAERMGKIIGTYPLDDDAVLYISENLQTHDPGCDLPLNERISSLEAAADAWNNASMLSFYQMSVYSPIETDANSGLPTVMRPAKDYPIDDITITLPYPSGLTYANSKDDDFKLLHMKIAINGFGTPEEISLRRNQNGLQAEVSSFSPYALAYIKSDDGNDGGNGDGNNGDGNNGDGSNGTGLSDPDTAGASSLPKTGDTSQFALWLALVFISLSGLTALRRRKHI